MRFRCGSGAACRLDPMKSTSLMRLPRLTPLRQLSHSGHQPRRRHTRPSGRAGDMLVLKRGARRGPMQVIYRMGNTEQPADACWPGSRAYRLRRLRAVSDGQPHRLATSPATFIGDAGVSAEFELTPCVKHERGLRPQWHWQASFRAATRGCAQVFATTLDSSFSPIGVRTRRVDRFDTQGDGANSYHRRHG